MRYRDVVLVVDMWKVTKKKNKKKKKYAEEEEERIRSVVT